MDLFREGKYAEAANLCIYKLKNTKDQAEIMIHEAKEKLKCACLGAQAARTILKKHKKELNSVAVSDIKTRILPNFEIVILDCLKTLKEKYGINTSNAFKC